jgi:hypothetical protein
MDSSEFLKAITDLFFVYTAGGGQHPLRFGNYGSYIKNLDTPGFVGGMLTQITTDEFGRLQVDGVTVSSVIGCGHTVTSVSQIAGVCSICGRICCNLNPSCLMVCDLKGIPVCRRHYKIKHGVIVSSAAQKGLWKLKARIIGHRKRAYIDDKRTLTERT